MLDLSDPEPGLAARPIAAPVAPVRRRERPRVGAHEQFLLGVVSPSVTLTRVQSGVGSLEIDAVWSPELADVRAGLLYQLRSGGSSTVQLTGGSRFAPNARRPVVVASREPDERFAIDLRQSRDIERLTVFAFSESGAEVTWSGTIVVTTFGGARIELPMESLSPGKCAVLLSILNMDGEFAIRAEMETIAGDVREAARAYGYDRITWRDGRTPVD